VLASAALSLAARIAIPVIVLNGVSGVASAQDATWIGPTPNWNTSANWNPMTIPGQFGTATFGGALPTSISMAGGVAVGTLQFNAPNYTFDALDGLTINGNGVNASLANAPTFNVIGTPFHSTPAIDFNGTSSAGTAQIILGQVIDTNNGFNAGFINFNGNSTAGQATITVRDQSATNFFNSSTAGHATLIVDNNGFVGFSATSNGDQARIINNAGGEVKIADLTTGGTSFGSIAGAGTYNLGSKQLTVGSNGDSTTVSGVIEDHFPGVNLDQVGGSLVKVGSGTLTLSGVNAYTGSTTVSTGELIVNGSIALSSLTTVNSGAVLSGSGTVGSTVINTGGFLIPGPVGTPGTMTVTGNLAFQSGAFYVVQVNPTTASITNVSGTASLAGTVEAFFAPGNYGLVRSYTILTSGGRMGTFDALTTSGLPADFQAFLSHPGNTAVINLFAQLVPEPTPPPPPPPVPPIAGLPPTAAPPPAPPSFTVNQLNVGHAIDNFFNNGGALPPAFVSLFGLTGSNLTNALDQLSGEVATGAQKVGFQLTDQFLNLMLDPFVDGRGCTEYPVRAIVKGPLSMPVCQGRWATWVGANGGGNHTAGDLAVIGSHDLSARTVGVAAGLDYHLTPDTVLGFALAGGGTNWNLSQGLGSGKSDAFQAGLYGTTRWGPAYLAGAFAFTNHWMTTDRTAVGDHLTADFNAQSYGGRLEGGYRFATLYGAIAPYAAIQAQSFHTPSYNETDAIPAGFALAFPARDAHDTRSELGARFDKQVLLNYGAVLIWRARAAWAHDWISDPNLLPMFESLPGAGFIVNGATPVKNSALASAGTELRLINGVSLLAKFDGEFANRAQTYAGTGTVRYVW
jgi:autotransporter-associated beta strand protein